MALVKHSVIVGAILTLSGCGISGASLNPVNWFTAEEEGEMVDVVAFETQTDPRPRVAVITSLSTDRLPGGIIVRATALPPEQGWYNGQLVVEASSDAAVRVYSFRGIPPETASRVSTDQSRELTSAAYVSDIELQGVRQIRVIGATNSRTIRP